VRESHQPCRGEPRDSANSGLSRVEQIKRFTILPTFWEPGGDEITPTMKLERTPVAAKYADIIDSLYAGAGEPAQADRANGPEAG